MSQSLEKNINAAAVALAHDAMADEYDHMDDLWYPWLFAQIHEFIAQNLPVINNRRPKALDVGCGTGLQSFLLSRVGYDVTAFDLAEKLIEVAVAKIPSQASPPLCVPPLFPSKSWNGIDRHNQRMAYLLESKRFNRAVKPPFFLSADVNDFDFEENKYGVIVCCGSVLSFVDNYDIIIKKMAGALTENGVIFLEVEQKRNMDLIWPIVDNLAGGKLGYEQRWGEVLRNLFSPRGKSIKIDYPFELNDGNEVILPMWLFSVNELALLFQKNNLQIKDRMGIHWATNILPSTILHRTDLGRFIMKMEESLMYLDGRMGRCWPMWRLGCSVVYCLERGQWRRNGNQLSEQHKNGTIANKKHD
jgi:ubiquinone/menaquinone biosynthesis C-methylase UbiE